MYKSTCRSATDRWISKQGWLMKSKEYVEDESGNFLGTSLIDTVRIFALSWLRSAETGWGESTVKALAKYSSLD